MNRQDFGRQLQDLFLFDDADIYAEAQRRIKECRANKGKKLDFSHLGLKEIPPEIAELDNLTELDISNVEFRKIPAFIGNIVSLQKLSVGSLSPTGHEREKLPPELGKLHNLRNLSLGYDIPEIPQWVWGFDNLDTLCIYNDTIESVPAEIAALKKLRELCLHGIKIAKLPDEIGEQLQLTALKMDCPQLGELPESFANLKTMRRFRFVSSNLITVPGFICGWTALETLEISLSYNLRGSYSGLKAIPKNIGNLKKLKNLGLGGPGISQIPDSLGNCPLEHLELSGNFKTFPESFGNLVNLKTIDLLSDKPIVLPVSFGNLSALKKLEIRAPALEIPASFGRLAALENVSLLTEKGLVLPKTFGGLSALKGLWINAPGMQVIPASMGNCKNLKEVNLGSDKLSTLPDSFCSLEKLETLQLDTFALKLLPGKFGSLTALKNFGIISGALKSLPESMGNLKRLKYISIDAYNIKKLPCWFKKLSYIKEKSINIGKEEPDELLGRRDRQKKREVISFTDLNKMSNIYRIKLLDTYSLKEIESVICSAPDYSSASADDKVIFRSIMQVRRRKLYSKFKWTEENKKHIATVSDKFIKTWEEGFAKARAIIAALHEDKYNVKIILYPEIVNFKEDGIYTEQVYRIISSYLDPEKNLYMHIDQDTEKNEDEFRQNIHIKRDLSWNIEGLGGIELEDYYICHALHILYVHNEWALEDIANINRIYTEMRVYCDGIPTNIPSLVANM
jgi:Leucine-rich repeat (LRR) protein